VFSQNVYFFRVNEYIVIGFLRLTYNVSPVALGAPTKRLNVSYMSNIFIFLQPKCCLTKC